LVLPTVLATLAARRLLGLDVVAAAVVGLLAQLGAWVIFGLILGVGDVVPSRLTGIVYIVAINVLGAVPVLLARPVRSVGD
jgi:hypothetical protein